MSIKTIILTLTLFISTLSFCNANAMEVNQINNNLNNQNNNKKDKIYYKKLEKLNSEKSMKVNKKFNLEIKNIFKPVKDSYFQKKYEDPVLIENLINAYLKNDPFKYKVEEYDIRLNMFLNDYETNGFVDVKLEEYCKHLKNKLLYDICLNKNKKLNRKNFIRIMKDHIESNIKINCSNVDFTIPEHSEKRLEKYFNEYKERIDNFLIEFQIKYKEITEKIENEKNKINQNTITPEMVEQFKKKLIQKISFYKNATIEFLERKVINESHINQKIIDTITNYNKEILLNYISLTENNKLDKDKFIRTLKEFKIIDNNSNYIINKEEELNLLIFLRKYKTKIEKESSKESVNNILKTSPILKDALELYIDNQNEITNDITSILLYPPSDKK